MTFWTLIRRSLRFHARSHLGTFLGAAIGSAILIGALAVGDSVRGSLRDLALARLGKTDFALSANDRFFRAQLADELNNTNFQTAAVLQLVGIAATDDGSARANRVQILGVNKDFWKLASRHPSQYFADETIAVNESLAAQLHAEIGDTILLRVQKPSLLSRDAPISPQQDFSMAFRLTLASILSDRELGNFNLRASQIPPQNAFVSQKFLQEKLGLNGKANLILAASATSDTNVISALQNALRKTFQLADAELELRALTNRNAVELRSARVFLDPPIVRTAPNANRVSTYFVNELRVGNRATPYSMLTAIGAPIVPPEMRDDEILINEWLAEDLSAKIGDELSVRFFVPGAEQQLEEKTNSFRIRDIVPLAGIYSDRDLMPEFPGVASAEKTEEWDAGFDIDMKKIRAKDEEYWKEFRGTPKAFVTLNAAEKMWSNRFGTFTALRFPNANDETIGADLQRNLDPASLGFTFQPVREQALAASSQSQDFGQLFLGFSFFLIFAALILVALLFQFSIEQRATEIGTLLALGFRPQQIQRLLLGEGAALAFFGGILGVCGGIFYARAMLLGLKTLWRDAVGTSSLQFHVSVSTLLIGFVSSWAVAVFTMWIALRNRAKRPACELLAQGAELEFSENDSAKIAKRNSSKWIFVFSFLSALALVGYGIFRKEDASPEIFFSAGSLLLIAGIAFAATLLKHISNAERDADFSPAEMSFIGLGIRNCARRRKRSLATIGLLACGSFLVIAVASNKLDATRNARERSSGTGGFTLLGESTLPIVKNLNEKSAREFFGLSDDDLRDVEFVSFRVRDGDDASCLNLNRAQTPRLLGVKPELLSSRNAFSFTQTARDVGTNPWLLLQTAKIHDNEIPAIGDANSIQWALGKKVGDLIPFTDEGGNKFNVRIVAAIANSILQGSLIVDEAQFVKRFPSASGYRMFLIDAPKDFVGGTLSRAFRDYGLELTRTENRLASFNAVQNTYLNTFQILGGLGLLLGSAGMGIVVLRNVLERRGELAVLLAIGFRRRALRQLVLSEHAALLCAGISLGIVAALVAVLPALLSRNVLPYFSLAATLGAVFVSGIIFTIAATSLALRGELLDALRNQ